MGWYEMFKSADLSRPQPQWCVKLSFANPMVV